VIIPTNGRECLRQAVEAIEDQVDEVILVATPGKTELFEFSDIIVSHDGTVNISKWWNLGLNMVATYMVRHWPSAPRYDVAIINDDVIVPPGWFDAVSTKMREMRAAAACAGSRLMMPELYTHVGPVTGISNPLEGFAFIVAGELGLRANEDIPWYFSDNYMDWESRKLGGTLVIPGFNVQHLYPNGQMTNDFLILNAQGIQAFVDLYGGLRPW
jgi:hypothetical protein